LRGLLISLYLIILSNVNCMVPLLSFGNCIGD
jgi:hypothetical protein